MEKILNRSDPEDPLIFLSSPIAGAMKARYSTSSFRNDERIAALSQVFARDLGSDADFFKTVVFEFHNANNVTMNWRLTAQEVDDLEEGLHSAKTLGG